MSRKREKKVPQPRHNLCTHVRFNWNFTSTHHSNFRQTCAHTKCAVTAPQITAFLIASRVLESRLRACAHDRDTRFPSRTRKCGHAAHVQCWALLFACVCLRTCAYLEHFSTFNVYDVSFPRLIFALSRDERRYFNIMLTTIDYAIGFMSLCTVRGACEWRCVRAYVLRHDQTEPFIRVCVCAPPRSAKPG